MLLKPRGKAGKVKLNSQIKVSVSYLDAKNNLYFILTELHMQKYVPKLSAIPKHFEIRSPNVRTQFDKYSKMIEDLLGSDNATVIYKIKVIVKEPKARRYYRSKKYHRKDHSKKYNVPLKKTSMKLSNFEVLLRKMAEESNVNSKKFDNFNVLVPSTSTSYHFLTTKQPQTKYKPIKSILNNYAKIIRPVKNKIITLTRK